LKKFSLIFLVFSSQFFLGYSQRPNQPPEKTRILFIFDASKSMLARWGKTTRMEIAKKTFNHVVDSLSQFRDVEMALRVFGHQSPVPPQDCADTKLEVPFGMNNAQKIRLKVDGLEAKGTTPIAYALLSSANDFPGCDNCRNIIVLITDGIEACDGDPCDASRELQRRGIVVKPFVIGIQLDDKNREIFNCVGDFYEADNEQQFSSAMRVIVSKALNATTTQINLFDVNGHPSETDVAISLYNREFNRPVYQYIHTINDRGVADTIYVDDRIVYRMVVHTIPPVEVDHIVIAPGTHNIISANAGRGKLSITQTGFQSQSFECIIRKDGSKETLSVQKSGTERKYLVGKYDIEVLSLPRIYLTGVEISQGHTTKIEIPTTGLVRFNMRNLVQGSIFLQNENDSEWIYDLNSSAVTEVVRLLPGYYRLVYRPKYSRKISATTSRGFEIVSGKTIIIDL
jgi:Ca-activated chloride channel homolog